MKKLAKLIIKPILTQAPCAKMICKAILRANTHLDDILNTLLPYTEKGIHPKHRLMNYHQYFLDRINETDDVLDIGCGQGIVSFDLSKKAKSVTGIDMNEKHIEWAKKHFIKPNLTFLVGDVRNSLPSQQFHVIILSNVLEHIEDRKKFLTSIRPLAPRILVRVPCLERDWTVLYRKELGIDYRLDKTHFIEYTESEIEHEIASVGFIIEEIVHRFGEYWLTAQRQNLTHS